MHFVSRAENVIILSFSGDGAIVGITIGGTVLAVGVLIFAAIVVTVLVNQCVQYAKTRKRIARQGN